MIRKSAREEGEELASYFLFRLTQMKTPHDFDERRNYLYLGRAMVKFLDAERERKRRWAWAGSQ